MFDYHSVSKRVIHKARWIKDKDIRHFAIYFGDLKIWLDNEIRP